MNDQLLIALISLFLDLLLIPALVLLYKMGKFRAEIAKDLALMKHYIAAICKALRIDCVYDHGDNGTCGGGDPGPDPRREGPGIASSLARDFLGGRTGDNR